MKFRYVGILVLTALMTFVGAATPSQASPTAAHDVKPDATIASCTAIRSKVKDG